MAGSSRVRVETVAPPGERLPGGEINTSQGTFAPGAVPSPVPPQPASAGIVSISLRPNVGDELTNVSGATATYVETSTLNAQFAGKVTSFPGAAGDSNNEQWSDIPVPINLAPVPNLRARVHLIVLS